MVQLLHTLLGTSFPESHSDIILSVTYKIINIKTLVPILILFTSLFILITNKILAQDFLNGIYILKIFDSSGKHYTGRFSIIK